MFFAFLSSWGLDLSRCPFFHWDGLRVCGWIDGWVFDERKGFAGGAAAIALIRDKQEGRTAERIDRGRNKAKAARARSLGFWKV